MRLCALGLGATPSRSTPLSGRLSRKVRAAAWVGGLVATKILVVDDEAPIRLLCRVNLEAHGMDVIEAEDGVAGLEAARHEMPDLILLGVMMPRMDGWEVAARLRSNPRTSSVPIVFLTARRERADRLRGFELGALDYITKPFNPVEIPTKVQHVLDRISRGEGDDLRREKVAEVEALSETDSSADRETAETTTTVRPPAPAKWHRTSTRQRQARDDVRDRPPSDQVHFHVNEYAAGGSPVRTLRIFSTRRAADAYAARWIAQLDEPVIAQGDTRSGFRLTSTVSNLRADLGALRVEACTRAGCSSVNWQLDDESEHETIQDGDGRMTLEEALAQLIQADTERLHTLTVAFRKANEELRKWSLRQLEGGGRRALRKYNEARDHAERSGALLRAERTRVFLNHLGQSDPKIVGGDGQPVVLFYEPVTRRWDWIPDEETRS
ncbi:MAG: response regulator [Gaiellaceae bacterium]